MSASKSIRFGSVLLTLALLTSCGTSTSKTSMSQPTSTPLAVGQGAAAPGGGTMLNVPVPADVLNVELFNSAGKSFTLNSLKGKTIVIADFLTSCQEICPMTSVNMRQIGDVVTASPLKDSVKVLEISVDSGRDTPTRLAAYQQQFGANTWTLASGREEGLKKLWAFFGNSYTKMSYGEAEKKALPLDWQTGKKSEYDVSHTDLVLIINADQSWAWLDLGNPNPGKANIPAKLKAYLSEEGLNNLAKPQEPSWTADAVLSALSSITGTKVSLANQ